MQSVLHKSPQILELCENEHIKGKSLKKSLHGIKAVTGITGYHTLGFSNI